MSHPVGRGAPAAGEQHCRDGRGDRQLAIALGPALLLAGVLLMLAPDAFTVSHLVFLAGTLVMLPAGVLLYDLAGDDCPAWLRWSGRALMCAGALALAGQFLVDLVVMRLAGHDRALAGPMFDTIQDSTPLALTLYEAGPALLFTGLALFGVAFLRRARLSGWLLVAGTLTEGAARLTGLRAGEVAGLGLVLAALLIVISRAPGWGQHQAQPTG